MELGKPLSNVVDLLYSRAKHCASTPLYTFLDRRLKPTHSISFSDLLVQSQAVAATLQSTGLSGKPLVLLFPHSPHFIFAFFGCIMAGSLPMPISLPKGSNSALFSRLIDSSRATGVLTTHSYSTGLPKRDDNIPLIAIDSVEARLSEEYRRPRPRSDGLAFVQYSSGSTSDPKGVAISHSNILDNSQRIRDAFRITSEDIGLTWLPFYHDMGLIGHVIQPLYSGIRNYFLSPLTFVGQPAKWMEGISTYQATISGAPNFAYDRCCKKIDDETVPSFDLSNWRLAYCGSDRILPNTVRKFQTKFAAAGFLPSSFYACYGLAESTLFVCGRHGLKTNQAFKSTQAEPSLRNYVSVGKIETADEVLIVDPETSRRLDNGVIGEICLHSPSTMQNYFHNPSQTAAAFISPKGESASLKVLRTGDLGFIHSNELFVTGRLKSLIKQHGSNYYAEDIEAIALEQARRHGIAHCAAVTVHGDRGDKLIIILESEKNQKQGVNQAGESFRWLVQVKSVIVQNLGIVPHELHVVAKSSLPLTSSGKLRRAACREMHLSNQFSYLNLSDAPSTFQQAM